VLLGIEHVTIAPSDTVVTPLRFDSYPYSHSLVALATWGVLAAVMYRVVRGSRTTTAAAVIAGVVISHWVLDWITHRPDMPITLGGSQRFGLELWSSKPATMIVENIMFFTGVTMYARATRPRDKTGTSTLAGLVLFLLVIHVASMFSPPPATPEAIAWAAQSIWILVAWGYWVDGHRTTSITG